MKMEPIQVNTKFGPAKKVTIEYPTGRGIPYLWLGIEGQFLGTIDTKKDLRRLQRMIGRVLDGIK